MDKIKIKFKKLNPNAKMPVKAHESDYCHDVTATTCEEIAPGVYKYGTGLAIEMDPELMTEYSACVTFRARSSVCKTGMVLANGIGTIDRDYRGEISAVFYHVMPDMPRYQVGDRIGQIHLDISPKLEFVEVGTLSETERAAGGYGSTGK